MISGSGAAPGRRFLLRSRLLVALDATYSTGDKLSGVGVYSRQILFGLASREPEARFLWYYRPHRFLRSYHDRLPRNCRRRLLFDNRPGIAQATFHGLNQRLPASRWKRRIATFHDLFVLTGDYSTPAFRARFAALAREAAARADLVIAVSEFTASQVEALLNVERSRLRVVPHGVALPPVRRERDARDKRILHVGALQRRKNLIRLVEAFETLDPEWILTLVGSDGFGAGEIRERIRRSPARGRIELTGYVPDSRLGELYDRAAVFAFPSLDEGFGMPVLEAMARGVPVLTSNRSALPEAAGDAALLVDPFRTDEIREGLRRLIAEPELRDSLAERGRRRAALFPWEAAVSATWSAYREGNG